MDRDSDDDPMIDEIKAAREASVQETVVHGVKMADGAKASYSNQLF
jgi:hypothetical protein